MLPYGWSSKERQVVENESSLEVLHALVHWCYTGRLAVQAKVSAECLSACQHMEADSLTDALEAAMQATGAHSNR